MCDRRASCSWHIDEESISPPCGRLPRVTIDAQIKNETPRPVATRTERPISLKHYLTSYSCRRTPTTQDTRCDARRKDGDGSPTTDRDNAPIDERKRGHVYDYAERTTRYVLLDPDVERARGEVARVANRERDRWF